MPATDAEVFGHYTQRGTSWEPLLGESSALFGYVVQDNVTLLEKELDSSGTRLNQFHHILYWGTASQSNDAAQQSKASELKTSVSVKYRSLVMLSAFHGSLRVLSYLLSQGADATLKSPGDSLTAYDFAADSETGCGPTVLAMLKDAEQPARSASMDLGLGGDTRLSAQDGEVDPFQAGGSVYNTSDLTRPEYSTDNFRMFCFKVLRCTKRHAHDWRSCPYAHPTENARRRDPREFRYCAVACPDYKQGFCVRGDMCPYSHGVFECWLHPSRFHTQLCKDGANCQRPVCFFAHSLPELRAPTHTWVPSQEDVARAGTSMALQQQVQETADDAAAMSAAASAGREAVEASLGYGAAAADAMEHAAASALLQCQNSLSQQAELTVMAAHSNGGRASGNGYAKSTACCIPQNGAGTGHNDQLDSDSASGSLQASVPRIARHQSDPLSATSSRPYGNGAAGSEARGASGPRMGATVRFVMGAGGGMVPAEGAEEGDKADAYGMSISNLTREDSRSNGSGNSGASSGCGAASSGTMHSGLHSPASASEMTSPFVIGCGSASDSLSHSDSSQCAEPQQNGTGDSTATGTGTGRSSGEHERGRQGPGSKAAAVAAAAAQAQCDVSAAAAQMVAAVAAVAAVSNSAKPGTNNLTQLSSTGLLGFTTPRMSNAFARRHGLNPKDNPMLNLQKIALQSHADQQTPAPQVPPTQAHPTAHATSNNRAPRTGHAGHDNYNGNGNASTMQTGAASHRSSMSGQAINGLMTRAARHHSMQNPSAFSNGPLQQGAFGNRSLHQQQQQQQLQEMQHMLSPGAAAGVAAAHFAASSAAAGAVGTGGMMGNYGVPMATANSLPAYNGGYVTPGAPSGGMGMYSNGAYVSGLGNGNGAMPMQHGAIGGMAMAPMTAVSPIMMMPTGRVSSNGIGAYPAAAEYTAADYSNMNGLLAAQMGLAQLGFGGPAPAAHAVPAAPAAHVWMGSQAGNGNIDRGTHALQHTGGGEHSMHHRSGIASSSAHTGGAAAGMSGPRHHHARANAVQGRVGHAAHGHASMWSTGGLGMGHFSVPTAVTAQQGAAYMMHLPAGYESGC